MGDATSPTDAKGRSKVQCRECENWYHRVDVHVATKHGMTVASYKAAYGDDVDLLSEWAKTRRDGKELEASMPKRKKAKAKAKPDEAPADEPEEEVAGDDVFRVGRATLTPRDESTLSARDLDFVPAHDEAFLPGKREMQQWEYLALGLEAGENVLIVGPSGCGKSTSVLELAAACSQPTRRLNLHGDVRTANFTGEKTIVVDEKTGQAIVEWRDGILPEAMRNGSWLLLDEIDAAPPAVLFVLQAVLEPHGKLVLADNHGEIVHPHESFRIVATANTLGRGDEAGLYAGTNVLNEAFLDRFGVVIEAEYPDEETEVKILVGRAGVKDATAKKMVAVAGKVRDAYRQEQCYCTFSTRRLIAWADKAKRLGKAAPAAEITVLNRLGGEDREFVRGVIQRYFPTLNPAKGS